MVPCRNPRGTASQYAPDMRPIYICCLEVFFGGYAPGYAPGIYVKISLGKSDLRWLLRVSVKGGAPGKP